MTAEEIRQFNIEQALKQSKKKEQRIKHTTANFRKHWWGHSLPKKSGLVPRKRI